MLENISRVWVDHVPPTRKSSSKYSPEAEPLPYDKEKVYPRSIADVDMFGSYTGYASHSVICPAVLAWEHSGFTQVSEEPVSSRRSTV